VCGLFRCLVCECAVFLLLTMFTWACFCLLNSNSQYKCYRVCYVQRRHALLEDSIHLYGFYRECDDFEKWIKDKERMLRADDSSDNVEAAKRKYEVRDLRHIFRTQNIVLAVPFN
jgi:hypothetical protein